VPPTPTPTTADRLENTVKSVISGDRVKSVEFANGQLNVDYDLGEQWNEGTAVRGMADTLARLAPKVFAIEEVNALQLRASADFNDVRGNKSHDLASNFKITRPTAASINWPNFQTRNLSRVLTGSGDGIYMHPALRQPWLDFQAGR
jgi:hypothetical protein